MNAYLKKTVATISLAASLVLTGCVSTELKTNDKYELPVEFSTTNPAMIFPVSLHGVPGNDTEVGLAITAGVAGKYGASVISAQQLYSVVGNLSWTLGESIRRGANKGDYQINYYGEQLATDLQYSMDKLTKALKSSGAIKDKNFSFENVIVLHVDSTGGIPVPGVRRVTAFGGIINVKNLEVISYIEKDLVLGNDQDAILAQMPLEMNAIVEELTGKK